MTASAGPPPAAGTASVARLLGQIYNLALAAVRSEGRQALVFKILNDTEGICRYDRAVLWALDGRAPVLLGVSGHVTVNPRTALASSWRELVRELQAPGSPAVLEAASFRNAGEAWEDLAAQTEGLQVLWLPLNSEGRVVAGLWLERWGEAMWQEDEIHLLTALADGYGAAWQALGRPGFLRRFLPETWRGWCAWAAVVLLAVYVLFLHPVRLRVTAPCEVVAREPLVVAAPLEGVVERAVVLPGQQVVQGVELFRYDPRVVEQEVKVAEQQVQIIQSRLKRARAAAFERDDALREIAILGHRMEQERARLVLARSHQEQLVVTAPAAGLVMMDQPHTWRGRPVQVGERVLEILDPRSTKLEIWIAEADRVDFTPGDPVRVFLHVAPEASLAARLAYVAPRTALSPGQRVGFLAEATWAEGTPPPGLGLKGTAVLYGGRTSLAYSMFRRPWTALRRWLGW